MAASRHFTDAALPRIAATCSGVWFAASTQDAAAFALRSSCTTSTLCAHPMSGSCCCDVGRVEVDQLLCHQKLQQFAIAVASCVLRCELVFLTVLARQLAERKQLLADL